MLDDADGPLTRYGLEVQFPLQPALVASAYDGDFMNRNVIPNEPTFTTPEAIAFVETFNRYWETTPRGPVVPEGGGDVRVDPDVPMKVDRLSTTARSSDMVFTVLPGGHTVVEARGLAISAGTANPEIAYQVVDYLSRRIDWGDIPARQSVWENSPAYTLLSAQEGGLDTFNNALSVALPDPHRGYVDDFIRVAFRAFNAEDMEATLAQAETDLIVQQNAAVAQRDNVSVTVAPAPVEQAVPADEIVLRFGYRSLVTPLPNREQWDDFLAEFATNDPEVGRVDFETFISTYYLDQDSEVSDIYRTQFDCFQQPIPLWYFDTMDFVLPLDPLTSADPSFDTEDFLPGVLDGQRRDGLLYGYPLNVQPLVIRYDARAFREAGLPLPGITWTAAEFQQALETLGQVESARPVLSLQYNTITYLLYIGAAFGELAFDLTGVPTTPRFTEPGVIAGLETVLGWVQADYIGVFIPREPRDVPEIKPAPMMITHAHPLFRGSAMLHNETFFDDNPVEARYVLYPAGDVQLIPYDSTVMYISADTAAPEACYRLIAAIAAEPALLAGGMPARSSLIAHPDVAALVDDETLTIYQTVDALLRDPATQPIPATMYTITTTVGYGDEGSHYYG